MSALDHIRNGDRDAAVNALTQLKSFADEVRASAYFDDADVELVTDTQNTFEEKLQTTAALNEIIAQRGSVINRYDALADTFRDMMTEFARRHIQMERMRDTALA